MNKLMRWKRQDNSTDNLSKLVLELSVDGLTWHHYTNPLFSNFRVSDSNITGASKGFPTVQNCLKLGFKFVDIE